MMTLVTFGENLEHAKGINLLNSGDKFIAVLSSAKTIPLFGGNSVFSVIDTLLNIQVKGWDHWRWVLAMESLGFLFIDYSRKKVVIEQPSLINSTKSSGEFYYIGARTPNQLEILKNKAEHLDIKVETEITSEIFPQRIILSGNRKSRLELAKQMNLRIFSEPFAYNNILTEPFLGKQFENLKYNDTLLSVDGQSNEKDTISFFNPRTLRYDGSPPSNENQYKLGLKEMFGKHFHLYKFREENKYQVHPDVDPKLAKWFCLMHKNIHLGFNRNQKTLVVPMYCPLPINFYRSIGLCECKPPNIIDLPTTTALNLGFEQNVTDFLEYSGVPEVIARIIAEKLGTELKFIN